jgi:hypothetical protein
MSGRRQRGGAAAHPTDGPSPATADHGMATPGPRPAARLRGGKRALATVHIAIALGWIGLTLVGAMRIALHGAREDQLGKQAAADQAEARLLRDEQRRLRDQLEWDASPVALGEAVKALNLPLADAGGRLIGGPTP